MKFPVRVVGECDGEQQRLDGKHCIQLEEDR